MALLMAHFKGGDVLDGGQQVRLAPGGVGADFRVEHYYLGEHSVSPGDDFLVQEEEKQSRDHDSGQVGGAVLLKH